MRLIEACRQAEDVLTCPEGEANSLLSRLRELHENAATLPTILLKFRLATIVVMVVRVPQTMVEQHRGKGRVWARTAANGTVTIHWERDENTEIMADHAYWRSRGVTMQTVEELLVTIGNLIGRVESGGWSDAVTWLNRSATSLESQFQMLR